MSKLSPYFQDLQIENELKIEIKIELEIDTYYAKVSLEKMVQKMLVKLTRYYHYATREPWFNNLKFSLA